MTRDEIIRMARDAGLGDHLWYTSDESEFVATERFAALVAAAEREACAKVCDNESRMHEHLDRNGRSRHLDDAAVAGTCAAAIRARGASMSDPHWPFPENPQRIPKPPPFNPDNEEDAPL